MSILPVSKSEYEALRAVVNGKAERAADLGPWANVETGALIEHTLNRLRQKELMRVPACGGVPELTEDGQASLDAYEAKQAAEPAVRPDGAW